MRVWSKGTKEPCFGFVVQGALAVMMPSVFFAECVQDLERGKGAEFLRDEVHLRARERLGYTIGMPSPNGISHRLIRIPRGYSLSKGKPQLVIQHVSGAALY